MFDKIHQWIADYSTNPRDFSRDFTRQSKLLQKYQLKYNKVYRSYSRLRRGTKKPVHLPIIAFKESRVSCVQRNLCKHYFESSGTTSQGEPVVSRHSFRSLSLYRESVLQGWKWFLTESDLSFPETVVGLMPSHRERPHSSLSCMVEYLMQEYGDKDSFWVMQNNRWNWHSLSKYLSGNKRPTVLFGTAFAWVHFIDWCAEKKLRFKLHPETLVLETGGYKGRSRELERTELHSSLSRLLGLSSFQIRSEYSMCELSSQAYSFPTKGHSTGLFRFPPWASYRIVKPLSSTPVKLKSPGVLEITDLANVDSCSFIRTEDEAIAYRDGFEIIGRFPRSGLKGCSLAFE